MPACTIDKETKELYKYLVNRDSFSVLSQSSEAGYQQIGNDLNLFQVSDEKAQACPSGDPLLSRFDLVDSTFAFILLFVSLGHVTLHFLGETFWLALAVYKGIYIRKLSKCGGFFMQKNRSV